jgi:hypothetical protein
MPSPDPDERICFDARLHGAALALPLAKALGFALAGLVLLALPPPYLAAGLPPLVAGAALAVRAVWRWDRTHLVLTTDQLVIVHGTLRRRWAAVRLRGLETVEVEETPLGRLIGYGTLVAGDLEIPYVPEPRRVYGLVHRLAA